VLRLVLRGEPVLLRARIVGGGDRTSMDHADGLLRAHDPDLGVRPGEREVRAQVLGVHRDEAAAIGLPQDDRDLRHDRLGERVQQLRAVPDHAELLLLRAGQEAGRVHEHHERDPERVADAHELRRLLRRLGVDHAAQEPGLVRDHADGAAVDPAERRDHVARPARGHLEHLLVVHDRPDDAAHVVDLARRLGHELGRVV
jgi:hypothetical protein